MGNKCCEVISLQLIKINEKKKTKEKFLKEIKSATAVNTQTIIIIIK